MSDDLPAQACVVFCALFSWLSMLRRGDGVLSLSSCGDGVEGVARTSFTPRHRSVAFASIYATSAPSVRTIGSPGDAGAYLERLELVLRLAHVRLEEGERAELLDPVARIPIYRIVPFMDLDAA